MVWGFGSGGGTWTKDHGLGEVAPGPRCWPMFNLSQDLVVQAQTMVLHKCPTPWSYQNQDPQLGFDNLKLGPPQMPDPPVPNHNWDFEDQTTIGKTWYIAIGQPPAPNHNWSNGTIPQLGFWSISNGGGRTGRQLTTGCFRTTTGG